MSVTKIIEVVADVASVATAIAAVWAWCSIVWAKRSRRLKLERYLKEQQDLVVSMRTGAKGQKSMNHLMANVQMTETQIYESAFASAHIKTEPKEDKNGWAAEVLFTYSSEALR